MLMHRKLKWMSGVNVAMDCEVGLARRGQRATAWANSRLGGRVEERCTPCNALLHANSVGKLPWRHWRPEGSQGHPVAQSGSTAPTLRKQVNMEQDQRHMLSNACNTAPHDQKEWEGRGDRQLGCAIMRLQMHQMQDCWNAAALPGPYGCIDSQHQYQAFCSMGAQHDKITDLHNTLYFSSL
eukprot:1136336-Pelagomonas_calceolata.AAC.1